MRIDDVHRRNEQKVAKETKIVSKYLPFNELFQQFENQLEALHHQWAIHRQVYLAGEEAIALLNRVAPEPLAVFENANEDAIVLRITCLCDDNGTGAVASMNGLLKQLPHELLSIRGRLEAARTATRDLARKLLIYRNNVVAHANGRVLAGVETIPDYTRDDIEKCISVLDEFGRTIHLALFNRATDYEPALLTGGRPLLKAMLAASKLEELVRRVETGNLSRDEALSALQELANSPDRLRMPPN